MTDPMVILLTIVVLGAEATLSLSGLVRHGGTLMPPELLVPNQSVDADASSSNETDKAAPKHVHACVSSR